MKILALSDRVVPLIYSAQVQTQFEDIDLVIGCGDLPYYYLEFVVTMLNVPLVYVHGNHDRPTFMSDGRIIKAPEGCISIDGSVHRYKDVLLAGMGGSRRYSSCKRHQYTEAEMRRRILTLTPHLLSNYLVFGRHLDILVTHSPPFGIHDAADLPHTGFKSFLTLMRYFRPRYVLHGHTHIYRRDAITRTVYDYTTVLNVYPYRVIEWEE